MQSQQAPARKATEKKRHGQRQSSSGTTDTSAQGSSGMQPIDHYRRYHWHRNDAGNRPAPQPSSNRGPGPSQWRNGGVGREWERQMDTHVKHRRARSPQQSAGPSHGRYTDGSVGPTTGNEAHRGMGQRRGSGQPSRSAPQPGTSPDGRHPMRPVPRRDGLDHQPSRAMRSPSRQRYSDCRPRPYDWRNSGVGRRQQDLADSRGEHRHADRLEHGAGPSRGRSLPDGRHPVRQVASKDGHGHQPSRAMRSPSRHSSRDCRPRPYDRRSSSVGRRQQDLADGRGEHRHAYHPYHGAGHSRGRSTDSSVGPMHGNQTHRGMVPRHASGQPSGSTRQPQNLPDGRHPMRPVASKDGHGHQPSRATRSPSRHPSRDYRPRSYDWHNSGVGQRQQDLAESRREHRRAYHPYHGAGPSQGHKRDGSTHGNQADSGRRRGTEQSRGSAPRPGKLSSGRHPVWAVPGKDWLSLLPNTEEPMEVEPPQNMDEPMQVDPPRPEQAWDFRSASLLSALQARQQRRRSARPAPYSSSRRLHRKQ